MRRTKAEMQAIKDGIYELCERYQPMTVRQLFYALSVRGFIAKTEGEYKTTAKLVKAMRLDGQLPWDWIADNTRWMHKPTTYGGISDLLESSQRAYRRALWDPATNPAYVEVWLEKDALSGVFYDVTSEFDVPLMPCRGYPSLSFVRSAAETMVHNLEARLFNHNEPRITIYYFGDFDPSGVDISRSTEARLREFIAEIGDPLMDALFTFKRVAVNHDQIEEMNLPTRPTKSSDSRAKAFEHDVSVELDAIDPDTLRSMIRQCLEGHIDTHQHQHLLATEAAERSLLESISDFTKLNGSAALAELIPT